MNNVKLSPGNHKSIEDGACVMEMVSYLANEPWSDKPACASDSVTRFCIWINDNGEQSHRDKLQTLVNKIINTKDYSKEPARAKLFSEFAFWNKDKAEEFAKICGRPFSSSAANSAAAYAADAANSAAAYAADAANSAAYAADAANSAAYATAAAATTAAAYYAANSAAADAANSANSAAYAAFKIELYDKAIETLEKVLAV